MVFFFSFLMKWLCKCASMCHILISQCFLYSKKKKANKLVRYHLSLLPCFLLKIQFPHFALPSPPPSGIWTWSLLQFTLVLSATHAPKTRPSINYPPPKDMIDEMTASQQLPRPVVPDPRGRLIMAMEVGPRDRKASCLGLPFLFLYFSPFILVYLGYMLILLFFFSFFS